MSITQQKASIAFFSIETDRGVNEDFAVVRQYIEQSTAQPQRPTYCGTGHCSCVECVVEPQAVVPAPEFTRLKFFRDLNNDERIKMLRVLMDLSGIPDDQIGTHGVQRQLFDKAFAAAQPSAQAERAPVVQAVQAGDTLRNAAQKALEGWHKYAEQLPQSDAVEALEWGAMNELRSALASSGATPAGVRMPTPEEPEKCYSLDEETFHEFGDFIDMLDEEQAKPGFLVYEGESVRHTASHYARGAVADLFERMGEQAFDDAGEHIGDWPDHAVKGNNSAELEKLIYDWLDANVKVNFYTIKNVREIALTAEMLGDNDAGKRIPADGVIGGV